MRRFVFVVGPEKSGSKIAARVAAHLCGIAHYNRYDGVDPVTNYRGTVYHTSFPRRIPAEFPDVYSLLPCARDEYDDIRIIICVRSPGISKISIERDFGRSHNDVQYQYSKAMAICRELYSLYSCLVWSYESFLFLGTAYINDMARYLDVTHVPLELYSINLVNGNEKWTLQE